MKEISYEGLNEKVYVHEHKSGLKTYMWINEKVQSCYMTMTVPYGSIHTKFKVGSKKYNVPNGLAHFLEHIKFNESDNFTAHDFFYKMGGDANAFTTFRHTTYVLFATTNLKENLNHLLDYIYNPYFTKKIVQKEKGIIIEEANMTNDDVNTLALFKHLKNMFSNSNYKNIITGEPEDIKQITVEDINHVYNAFYHPQNMFLCLTGNFNPYEMAKIIDDNLDQKEFNTFIKPVIINEKEPKEVVKNYEEINLNVSSPKVRYGIKIARSKFKNFDNWHLSTILKLILAMNFEATSDFREELINSGLITEIYATMQIIDDYVGIFICADTNYPKEVIKKIEEKLQNLELDPQVIERKKKVQLASLILEFDDIEEVNNFILSDMVYHQELMLDIKEKIKNINYAMFEEVKNNLDLKYSSILVVNPLKEKE